VQESEGGRATLRFSSIRVREGDRRWHATRWREREQRRRPEPRKEAMGKLGQYHAKKARVGWCAGRPERKNIDKN
jgi:hypothetical protein